MAYRSPNMVSQAALFKTGTPNYFDPTLGAATEGANGETFRTFSEAATAEGWANGDVVGVLAVKANGDYRVWKAIWEASSGYLKLDTEEVSTGTLWTDNNPVTLSAVVTAAMFVELCSTPTKFQSVVVAGTTYTVTANDNGKSLCFTNSAGCAVTLDDALPVGFQVQIIQEGIASVNIDVEGTDTLNGAGTGTGIDTPEAFSSKFVYQRTEGAWVAV